MSRHVYCERKLEYYSFSSRRKLSKCDVVVNFGGRKEEAGLKV
jgi:hypothetical protein